MAFRTNAVLLRCSIDSPIDFNGILDSKPEVQEFIRVEFGHKMYPHIEKSSCKMAEARVRPQKGDESHPSGLGLKRHSTSDLDVGKDRPSKRKFSETIHIYHDEDDYKAAEKKVKQVNIMSHENAQEDAHFRKALAAEPKLEAEEAASQNSDEQPAPKA